MGSGIPYSSEWKNSQRSSTDYRYSTTNAREKKNKISLEESNTNTTPAENGLNTATMDSQNSLMSPEKDTDLVTKEDLTKKRNIDYKKALKTECMLFKGFILNIFKSHNIDDETKYNTFLGYINRIIDILEHIDKAKAKQLSDDYNRIKNEYASILKKYKESEMKREKQKFDAFVKGAKLEENLSYRTIETEIIEFSNKIDAYTSFADKIINI